MAKFVRYNNESGRSNFTTLIIVSIGIIFALGALSAFVFSRLIDRAIVDALIKPSALSIQQQMRLHLFEQDRFYNWQDPMSVHHFGEFLKEAKTLGDVTVVNIFSKEKRIDFSTVAGNIGKTVNDPAIDRALKGELIFEEPAQDAISNSALKDVIVMYIPATTDSGSVQGVVTVYVNEAALFVFRKQLYLLIVILGLSSVLTIVIVIYAGFRNQSEVIKQQAKELSTIIDKAPIGIYIVNKEGIVEVFNPKMMEFSGVTSADKIIGVNVFELQTYKDAGLDVFLKKGFVGESLETEVEYTSHISGKKMWRHYRGVPLTSESGEIVDRLLLIVEDATERRKLEQNLEATVTSRTKELSEKLDELEKFKEVMVGRELKMIELKKMIDEKKIG